MVGIGGGVPHPEHDIRLGDVVVGYPRGISGGVVAFEVGKAIQDTTEYRGHFNSAPDSLRNAANALATDKGLKLYQGRMAAIMRNASDKLTEPAWPPPSINLDVLHCSKAAHDPNHRTDQCYLLCDPASKQARRLARQDRTPKIHCGLIGSSHKVIADERQRDYIVGDLQAKFGFKILCFEMEAFSLANKFPCLIVRGISDYADSRKSDTWQRYASLSAAAYAKELLITLRPTVTEHEKSLLDQSEALSRADPEEGLYRRVMSMFLKDKADPQEHTMLGDEDDLDRADLGVTPAEWNSDETLNEQHEMLESEDRDDAQRFSFGFPDSPEAESLPESGTPIPPNHAYLSSDEVQGIPIDAHQQGYDGRLSGAEIRERVAERLGDRSNIPGFAQTGFTGLLSRFRDADLEVIDSQGQTPLHIAAEQGHTEIVAHLHRCGLHVDHQASHAMLPIHFAAKGGHITTVDYLQRQGASTNPEDDQGWKPIHYAAWAGHRDLIVHLVGQGHSATDRSAQGELPLHLAAERGNVELIDYFNSLGIPLNTRDNSGWTPLHFAAKGGQIYVVEHLVRLRQNPKVTSNTGKGAGTTLFHVVAMFGQDDLLLYLQNLGVDVRAPDRNGRTPRALASHAHWHTTASYLEIMEEEQNLQEEQERQRSPSLGRRLLRKISPR